MENLFDQTWFIATLGLVAGWVIAKLGGVFGDGRDADKTDNYVTQINSLKAQVNVAQKERDIATGRFDELQQAVAERDLQIQQLETAFEARGDQLQQTKTNLKDSVAKTGELRRELVERAEDTVRAKVHARDVENELELLQGSGELLDAELMDVESGKD